jgi:hypothetical protein
MYGVRNRSVLNVSIQTEKNFILPYAQPIRVHGVTVCTLDITNQDGVCVTETIRTFPVV